MTISIAPPPTSSRSTRTFSDSLLMQRLILKKYLNFSYYNIRGNIGALTSKNKQLEEVIASNEKENVAKRVEYDHRSKTANLFEEDLEHMNRVQTKATKVQLNTIWVSCDVIQACFIFWISFSSNLGVKLR